AAQLAATSCHHLHQHIVLGLEQNYAVSVHDGQVDMHPLAPALTARFKSGIAVKALADRTRDSYLPISEWQIVLRAAHGDKSRGAVQQSGMQHERIQVVLKYFGQPDKSQPLATSEPHLHQVLPARSELERALPSGSRVLGEVEKVRR